MYKRQAASLVAAYLRERRPDVVVTYDVDGGYGHPDHIQTRRVVQAAITGLAPAERPGRFFETLTPRSWVVADRQWLAEQVPEASGLHIPTQNEPYAVSVVDDAVVSHVVVDEMAGKRMTWALAAHRTQVTLFDGYYSLSLIHI